MKDNDKQLKEFKTFKRKRTRFCFRCGFKHVNPKFLDRGSSLSKQERATTRFVGTVTYNGTSFHGFQRQTVNGIWNMWTVQLCMEEGFAKALHILDHEKTLLGAKSIRSNIHLEGAPTEYAIGPEFGEVTSITVTPASRTDSGVHALQQVCHIDIPSAIVIGEPFDCFMKTVNSILPSQVRLLQFGRPYAQGFDASRDSIGKRYSYMLYDGQQLVSSSFKDLKVSDLYNNNIRRYAIEKVILLDANLMDKAAKEFVGAHDFRLFTRSAKRCNQKVDTKERTTRTIYKASVCRIPAPNNALIAASQEFIDSQSFIQFEVEGDGFLFLMVRCMMNALINVGRKELDPILLRQHVRSPSYSEAIPPVVYEPASPCGLSLVKVYYGTQVFQNSFVPDWFK